MKTTLFLSIATALFVSGLCVAETPVTQESVSEFMQKNLARPIHPQFGACNGDLLDYPLPPVGQLQLKDLDGKTVDVLKEYSGRPVVLLEVNATVTRYQRKFVNWQEIDGKPAPAVAILKRLRKEYPSMAFVLVWTAMDKKKTSNVEDAKAYMKRNGLTLPVLMDQDDPTSRKSNCYVRFVNSKTPGHSNGGTIVCVLNKEGKIVYRHHEKPGVSYHSTRNILDRLLDAKYDTAVRKEFIPEKSRLLPGVKEQADGLLYTDDFESYSDNHTFLLEPRWGFTYSSQSYLDVRPDLQEKVGRNGTKGIYINEYTPDPGFTIYGLRHRFPALTDGWVKFYIRRHPAEVYEHPPRPHIDARRAFSIALGKASSHELAGHILASGDWMKEKFTTSFRMDKLSDVSFSKDVWHEIKVLCSPGNNATVQIDGREIGTLQAQALDWIGFRTEELIKDFYVDDVEIFYRGDAKQLKENHLKLQPKTAEAVVPFTPEEIAALQQMFMPQNFGKERIVPEGNAIPRADIGKDKKPWFRFNFDRPLVPGPLLMENLREPGKIENVIEKHKGKIIWITKAHKGDHNTERNMRRRTFRRSVTVFNRMYRLAREYGPKGVVVIGIAAHDGGHRDTVTTYEDRIRTAMECIHTTRAIAEEGKLDIDQVTYGFGPEVYSDVYAERHANQMRLWTKTLVRRSLESGSFGGFGVDAIIDTKGRIVYRGAGPDGSGYWKERYVLDRLLDPKFDAACRQEFRNPDLDYYKSPLLPQQQSGDDGLYYRDDFESYESTYDFGLQPRWGFTYENIPNAKRPAIFASKGRNNSKAILLNLYYIGDTLGGNWAGPLGSRHELPAPLKDGHFRFFIKRGPKVGVLGQPSIFRLAVTCFTPDGKAMDTLTTTAEWKKEHFVTTPTEDFLKNWNCKKLKKRDEKKIVDTGVSMAEDQWQEIRFVCKPGEKVKILINGKPAATLGQDAIGSIEFRGEVWSGVYIDDAELFYAGDGETLGKQHENAIKEDLTRRQGEWKKETADWDTKLNKGKTKK